MEKYLGISEGKTTGYLPYTGTLKVCALDGVSHVADPVVRRLP